MPPTTAPATAPATLAITGARVVTLDAHERTAQAVAVAGERILAVGSDAEVAALCDAHTQRIDVAGRLVVPGLIDGHAHMDREGLKERLPSLAGCTCIDDVLQRIAALVDATEPGDWVVTMPIGEPPFYEGVPGNLREGRVPDRHDLDRVSPRNPVYIRPIWGNWRNTLPLVSVANSLALARAGISRETLPPSPNIHIDRELSSGEPSGIFYEFTYKPLVEKTLMACIPRFDLADRTAGLRRSMDIYAAHGTTSVFEGHGIAGEVLAAYQQLRAEGPLKVRATLMFSPAWPDTSLDTVRSLLNDWGRWLAGRGLGDSYLRMAGLYTESDRSEDNRLRALCGPYTGWAGFNFNAALPESVMVEMMVEAARAGIRVGSFTPGIIGLFEQVDRRVPIARQRWLVEHIGILDADDIARARDLGLVMQAYSHRWIWQQGEQHRAALGEANAGQVLPLRALLDAGVHVALASDNVPPSMFVPIWHAVARRTRDGERVLGAEQCLTPLEALACASREGAYLSFEEDFKGTLGPGKAADLAVLSEDLLGVDTARIPHIHALLTVTGGRIVHRSGLLP